MSYFLARALVHFVVWLTSRVEVINRDQIELPESFIAVSNHIGRLDVAFVYYFLNRRDVTVLVAEKYQKSAFFRWAVKAFDAVWVDRFNADLVAMRNSLKRLREGHILVMAPEGTRSQSGQLIQARGGASYLAAKSAAWIVPVAVTGTEDRIVFNNIRRLRRSHVKIRVGEPFKLPPIPRENREAILQQYSDEMMCRIAVLLPEAYRGFYADHPRLQELLVGAVPA